MKTRFTVELIGDDGALLNRVYEVVELPQAQLNYVIENLSFETANRLDTAINKLFDVVRKETA